MACTFATLKGDFRCDACDSPATRECISTQAYCVKSSYYVCDECTAKLEPVTCKANAALPQHLTLEYLMFLRNLNGGRVAREEATIH